ncbi:hypothetical protein [Pigmentiphaga humi]|uniref:hypothetical protein n=1 Tax=Pigmentiphaga humi TaxID=2478468 RepID=UPI001FECCDED|nr:hypothetical protein [Pigmentiphaga humi]
MIAIVLALPGFGMAFGSGGYAGPAWHPRRLRPLRRLLGLALLALSLVAALLAFTVHRYLQLFEDRQVATIEFAQEGPQRFRASVMLPPGPAGAPQGERRFTLLGDAWQIDARVLRWRLPAALAGVPSLYRLDRIGGRYDDVERERTAPRSVYALDGDGRLPDLWMLKREFSRWLPYVDAEYGSATFMPMFDGARYLVLFNDRGGLLAKPADAATAARLRQG